MFNCKIRQINELDWECHLFVNGQENQKTKRYIIGPNDDMYLACNALKTDFEPLTIIFTEVIDIQKTLEAFIKEAKLFENPS